MCYSISNVQEKIKKLGTANKKSDLFLGTTGMGGIEHLRVLTLLW